MFSKITSTTLFLVISLTTLTIAVPTSQLHRRIADDATAACNLEKAGDSCLFENARDLAHPFQGTCQAGSDGAVTCANAAPVTRRSLQRRIADDATAACNLESAGDSCLFENARDLAHPFRGTCEAGSDGKLTCANAAPATKRTLQRRIADDATAACNLEKAGDSCIFENSRDVAHPFEGTCQAGSDGALTCANASPAQRRDLGSLN